MMPRRARSLGEPAQVVDRRLVVRDRVRRHVAAQQQAVGAELRHQVELALGPVEVALLPLARCALEVAEGLEERDLEAEVARQLPDVAGRALEVGEVALEDLDRVEARRGRGLELLRQGPAQADRGDRVQHGPKSPVPARKIDLGPTEWMSVAFAGDRAISTVAPATAPEAGLPCPSRSSS